MGVVGTTRVGEGLPLPLNVVVVTILSVRARLGVDAAIMLLLLIQRLGGDIVPILER